jgi:hypothetical protein
MHNERCRGQRPGHHDQVPATHNELRRGQRPGATLAAGNGLFTMIKYLRAAVDICLGTTIRYLRGGAGTGLGTTIKYPSNFF